MSPRWASPPLFDVVVVLLSMVDIEEAMRTRMRKRANSVVDRWYAEEKSWVFIFVLLSVFLVDAIKLKS